MWIRWGTSQNFCLAFLMNLKNHYLLKNCWSGPIKNVRILIFKMLYFFKKIMKNTYIYHYFGPLCQKSWYDHQFLRYRVWQTEIGNYGSFFAPSFLKTQKIRILEKWKIAGDIIILYMCTENHNPVRYGSWDMDVERIYCHFVSFFALWPSYSS